ncbi:SAM-dependent methyltransferase [Dokdonella fugitiva]|uniref:SAM-dependent methyltransferase n=1 Tax=Dokdonella fugitiva TaxID=328517 RepID=A0A839ES12_9GAMM|nr:methyltransferase domain-containing protein [Dokdonella fugitiva]MBA8886545.1 SAM-dependent methyltransferase [Dokdonella fugitiva]
MKSSRMAEHGTAEHLPDPLPRKINVGCGYDRREGYLNVDLHAVHNPDLVGDVVALPMLPSGAFDEVLAQDVLEHFERAKTAPALQEWSRLLAPGGVLHVRVPALAGMFDLLSQPERRDPARAEEIIHLVYGTQAYTGDYHLAGFTAQTLDGRLRDAGLLVCEASILHGWLFDVRARKTDRLDDDREFVHSAYFSILGRPADAGGLANFADALAQRRMTRDDVTAALRNSAEARFLANHPAYLLPYAARIEPGVGQSLRNLAAALLRLVRRR